MWNQQNKQMSKKKLQLRLKAQAEEAQRTYKDLQEAMEERINKATSPAKDALNKAKQSHTERYCGLPAGTLGRINHDTGARPKNKKLTPKMVQAHLAQQKAREEEISAEVAAHRKEMNKLTAKERADLLERGINLIRGGAEPDMTPQPGKFNETLYIEHGDGSTFDLKNVYYTEDKMRLYVETEHCGNFTFYKDDLDCWITG